MKPRLLKKIPAALVGLMVCLAFNVSAQQSVTVLTDSLLVYTNQCPTPVTAYFSPFGEADNYNSTTDSIDIEVFWGDGTSDVETVQLFEAGVTDFWYSNGFTHTYNMAGTFFPYVIATAPNNIADTASPIDSVYVTTNCVTIDGYAYEDNNNNCLRDGGDGEFHWIHIKVEDANGLHVESAWTDTNGYYSLTVPTGLSNLVISAYDSYGRVVVCPTGGGTYTFNSSTNQSFDFALECPGSDYDKYVWSGSFAAPPGDTGWVSATVRASRCNSSLIGADTLTMILDPLTHYVGPISGYPAPDVVNGNTLTWYFSYSISNYSSYHQLGIQARVYVETDTSLFLNDTICHTSYITSPPEDFAHSNNTNTVCPPVGVAYDPNNKVPHIAGDGPLGNIDTSTTSLTYTLNFQNTGTASAKNVYIIDSISDNLDLESIRILSSSHNMNLLHVRDRVLRFDFPKIYLPDSASDPQGSQGYVIFTIDLVENLPIGTQIENTGHIFFDYNPPIVTNTTLHTLYVEPFIPDPLVIALNAEDVTCKNTDNGRLELEIISGNPPYSISWNINGMETEYEGLSAGTYTVFVTDDEQQIESATVTIEENRIHDDPVIGEVTGATEVQSWSPYTYTIDDANGSSFTWSAVGGEIINATNNQAEVRWNAGPEGVLYVSEKDTRGCIGNDSTLVSISVVGISDPVEGTFSLYPNPTNGQLTIELSELKGDDRVTVVDAQGRVVFDQQALSTRVEADLQGLSKGIYTVHVSNTVESNSQRLILH